MFTCMNKLLFLTTALCVVGAGCVSTSHITIEPSTQNPSITTPPNDTETVSTDTAGSKVLKSVADYYTALPDEFMVFPDLAKNERVAQIEILDEKNLYLKLRDNVGPGPGSDRMTMAVFIKPDGSHLIAVSGGHCSEICFNKFYLLTFDGFTWTDVTSNYFEERNRLNVYSDMLYNVHIRSGNTDTVYDWPYTLYFELPQQGTTILIREDFTGMEAGSILYKNGRFTVEPGK